MKTMTEEKPMINEFVCIKPNIYKELIINLSFVEGIESYATYTMQNGKRVSEDVVYKIHFKEVSFLNTPLELPKDEYDRIKNILLQVG